jgi:hypothetical protein
MIAAVKSKGVPVIWVGLPAIRGTKATSDMSYLDELYRERAERAGIIYVDIWDGFVDEDGDYAMQGPDFEGQTRRLRTADGVYFTKAGAVKIASYVDRELRRVMPSYVAPVALPGPEPTPKSGTAGARPDVGPVLPLTSSAGDHGTELLGGKDHSTRTTSDSIAAKVLSRGETLAAPAGRADDFSWPRPGSDASVGLRFRLNRLQWRLTHRKSKTLRRKTMAKTKPLPRRMRRRNPQATRASARGSRRTVIITTTPDDITAGTVDITTAGTPAGKWRPHASPLWTMLSLEISDI